MSAHSVLFSILSGDVDLNVSELSTLETKHMFVDETADKSKTFFFFDRDGAARHYDDWKECAAAITLVWS
jgi:hypothetical protein